MSDITLPFVPSNPDYEFSTTIGESQYTFVTRWNSRDEAWYFDMYDIAGQPMAINVKIVLGTYLGRRSTHRFFSDHAIVAIDTTLEERDAGYDDLGTRIEVHCYDVGDLFALVTMP